MKTQSTDWDKIFSNNLIRQTKDFRRHSTKQNIGWQLSTQKDNQHH